MSNELEYIQFGISIYKTSLRVWKTSQIMGEEDL